LACPKKRESPPSPKEKEEYGGGVLRKSITSKKMALAQSVPLEWRKKESEDVIGEGRKKGHLGRKVKGG